MDAVCKKIERVALDSGNDSKARLVFKVRDKEESEYLDYIKTFSWWELKYSTKKSLAELCALITKEMRTRDDQVKRQQDEVNKIRNEYAAVTKKEGGNLMTKDFTDDIYERGFEDRWFIPETSEMFCNLLVVVPNLKLQEFKTNYWRMIEEYYQNNDAAEEQKIPELVEKKYKAMKEQQGEAWEALVKSVQGGEPGDFTEGDEKNALNILRT